PEAEWIDKKKPLDTQTKTFDALKEMAREGVSYHWGRNSKRKIDLAEYVKIANEKYEVYVDIDAANDSTRNKKMYMKDIELVFNTNRKSMRSRNLGKVVPPISTLVKIFLHARAVYHTGHIYTPRSHDRWEYWHESIAVADFKYTVAHEIGHEILQAFGNAIYSYRHKGTSTLSQKTKKGAPPYPVGKEIDLMIYYNGNNPDPYYKIHVATVKDALNLIWLAKVGIK
ncbi:MAG: hypothetical protein LBD23_19100, partial [Oscillospiraceae bacterium]|nr:hypothetical protein [Oscillospiraceae bacterium]